MFIARLQMTSSPERMTLFLSSISLNKSAQLLKIIVELAKITILVTSSDNTSAIFTTSKLECSTTTVVDHQQIVFDYVSDMSQSGLVVTAYVFVLL